MYYALLHLGNVRIKNYRLAFVSSINYFVFLFQTTYYPRELFLRKVGVLLTGICMLNCEKKKKANSPKNVTRSEFGKPAF